VTWVVLRDGTPFEGAQVAVIYEGRLADSSIPCSSVIPNVLLADGLAMSLDPCIVYSGRDGSFDLQVPLGAKGLVAWSEEHALCSGIVAVPSLERIIHLRSVLRIVPKAVSAWPMDDLHVGCSWMGGGFTFKADPVVAEEFAVPRSRVVFWCSSVSQQLLAVSNVVDLSHRWVDRVQIPLIIDRLGTPAVTRALSDASDDWRGDELVSEVSLAGFSIMAGRLALLGRAEALQLSEGVFHCVASGDLCAGSAKLMQDARSNRQHGLSRIIRHGDAMTVLGARVSLRALF
jgi:hypothetical protein